MVENVLISLLKLHAAFFSSFVFSGTMSVVLCNTPDASSPFFTKVFLRNACFPVVILGGNLVLQFSAFAQMSPPDSCSPSGNSPSPSSLTRCARCAGGLVQVALCRAGRGLSKAHVLAYRFT